MALGADRYATRRDTLVFLACVALSLVAMSLPVGLRDPIASGLRRSVLLPLLQLQTESELLRTSRARFAEVVAERDSAALAATFIGELRAENARLRSLLGLTARMATGFVPAEVLHQAVPTEAFTLTISAGTHQGVRVLDPVVAPDGLLGIVSAVDPTTSEVVTWAHDRFRASGMSADGSVYGILAPHPTTSSGVWLMELRGVPYRQHVPLGTTILTSGLGGILPRGIPVGTIVDTTVAGTGVNAMQWERTFLVLPAVPPGAVSHVMVLITPRGEDLQGAFAPGAGAGDRVP
jgi:cell shape-determining protein MreC